MFVIMKPVQVNNEAHEPLVIFFFIARISQAPVLKSSAFVWNFQKIQLQNQVRVLFILTMFNIHCLNLEIIKEIIQIVSVFNISTNSVRFLNLKKSQIRGILEKYFLLVGSILPVWPLLALHDSHHASRRLVSPTRSNTQLLAVFGLRSYKRVSRIFS